MVDKTFLANAENGGSGRPFAGELPTQNENQKCMFQNLFFRNIFLKRVGNSPAKKVVEKHSLQIGPMSIFADTKSDFCVPLPGGKIFAKTICEVFAFPSGGQNLRKK